MPWGFCAYISYHIISCMCVCVCLHTQTPVCIHAGADVFGCDAPYSPLQSRDRQPRGKTGASDERECAGTRRASKLAVRWGGNMALVQEGDGHGRGVKGHQSDVYRGADFGPGQLQEVRRADRCECMLCVYACIHAWRQTEALSHPLSFPFSLPPPPPPTPGPLSLTHTHTKG